MIVNLFIEKSKNLDTVTNNLASIASKNLDSLPQTKLIQQKKLSRLNSTNSL